MLAEQITRTENAIIIDLPQGYADDPPKQAGLAALCARYLASTSPGCPGHLAAKRAWRTRHRLVADCSSFSYWSVCDEGFDEIIEAFCHAPPPESVDHLVQRQLRLAERYQRAPFAIVSALLHEAAYGVKHSQFGTAASLATIKPDEVADYLRRCRRGVRLLESAQSSTGWLGGTHLAGDTAAVARVAVAIPVADSTPGALELAVELLGRNGINGRLGALRRVGAYGLGAFSLRQGTHAIAAHAQVRSADAAETAKRLLAAIRSLTDEPPEAGERVAAATRVQTALLLEVDQPFGHADELRRRRLGEASLIEVASNVRACAEGGDLPEPQPDARIAMAAVGTTLELVAQC